MNNVMSKFVIYLSIYFYLTCFGFYFSQSSEEGVHLRQLFKSAGYGVSAWANPGVDTLHRRLEPLPKLYTFL
jgi:hypothetical protein